MKIIAYGKTTCDMAVYTEVLNRIRDDGDEISAVVENRRSFRELDRVLKELRQMDVIVIDTIGTLGMNDGEAAARLRQFIKSGICLAVCDVPSTYEYGISQPMNRAVLQTLEQALRSGGGNTMFLPRRSGAGRSKVMFPENWDELYAAWARKEISSAEFIERSGLRKATFYNLVTEYRILQKANEEFIRRLSG